MGLALMLLTLLGAIFGGVLIRNAWKRRQYSKGMRVVKLLALWLCLYFVALLTLSFASKEKIAGGGEDVRFCDVLGNCDRTASVIGVDRRRTIGSPPHEMISSGIYCFVTVKVISYTPFSKLEPEHLRGVVVDGQGHKYSQFQQGQTYVDANQASETPYELHAGPGGGSYKRVLVFDLPANLEETALILQEGSFFDRIVELFLIGDEDSMFHSKTRLLFEIPKPQVIYNAPFDSFGP